MLNGLSPLCVKCNLHAAYCSTKAGSAVHSVMIKTGAVGQQLAPSRADMQRKREQTRERESGGKAKLIATHTGTHLGKMKKVYSTTVSYNPPCILKKVQKNLKYIKVL